MSKLSENLKTFWQEQTGRRGQVQGKTGEGEPDAINVVQMLSQGQLPALVAGTAPVQARTPPLTHCYFTFCLWIDYSPEMGAVR